jgi:pimeloyl-ACP methyl ester carboxylesterase
MMNTRVLKIISFLGGAALFLCACTAPTAQPTATPIPPTPTLAQPGLVIQPGSLAGKVDIGGRNLYIICLGEGSPTVIFEAGWGGDWSNYSKAITAVSKHTTACGYDRAGLGQSDPITTKPRTSQDMVGDLHALLTNAPIPGPFILVGHSLGGFNIRLYATQYPQDVVGLVSVEGVPVDQFVQCDLPAETPGEDPSFAKARKDCQTSKEAFLNWDDKPEFLDYFASEDQVRASGSFGDLPLVVLAAETSISGRPGSAEEFQGAIWDRQEREIAALSSNSQYIVVKSSNHATIISKQETIDAIIGMVQSLQNE